MTIDINAILKDILLQSETLAATMLKDFSNQGLNDVKQFLIASKDDLARWSGELSEGQITKEEFTDLVQGQVDVALLHGLKETGLGEIELDKFKNGVIDIVTKVVMNAAGKVI